MSCRGRRHDNNDSLVWIQKRCDCLLMPYITIPICGQSILFPCMLNCLTNVVHALEHKCWLEAAIWWRPNRFHMHQKGGQQGSLHFWSGECWQMWFFTVSQKRKKHPSWNALPDDVWGGKFYRSFVSGGPYWRPECHCRRAAAASISKHRLSPNRDQSRLDFLFPNDSNRGLGASAALSGALWRTVSLGGIRTVCNVQMLQIFRDK